VAYVSVATTNVIKWDDVADDLNKPQFTPTATELLNDAVQVTSSVNAQSFDALTASLAAAFSGTSINKTNSTSTDASGAVATTSGDQRSRQTPNMPSDVTFNIQPPSYLTSNSATVAGTEAQLKYDVAKALAEEVAIKNREVSSIAQRTGYRPYFVNMKVAVEPLLRGYPYDIFLDLTLKTKSGGPIVLPLLVTDAMEVTSEAQTAQIVRQLGAELKATAGFASASTSLQRTLSRLDQTLAQRSNSLLTIAQFGESGVRVRLGANAYGETYEMISRTHSISLIVLIPYDIANSSTADDRMVSVVGELNYYDAGGAPEVKSPGPFSGPVQMTISPFQVPKQEETVCPSPQDAILDVVSIDKTSTKPAVKYDSIVLAQGQGLQGRQITGSLDTFAPGKGKPLHLVATSAVPAAGSTLQFTFPEHTAFVGGEQGGLRTGTLTFTIQKNDVQQEVICPGKGDGKTPAIYRVIYPTIAVAAAKPGAKVAVRKPSAAAAKASKKPAVGTTEAVTAPALAAPPIGQPGNIKHFECSASGHASLHNAQIGLVTAHQRDQAQSRRCSQRILTEASRLCYW
jgi:hypothetical protein